MAIAFRNAQGSNNAGGGTSIVMTMPTSPSVSDGDILLMVVNADYIPTTIGTPSGWTVLNNVTDGNTNTLRQAIFWRVASSEPASYTVSLSPTAKASGGILALSGASTTQPTSSAYGAQGGGSSSNVIAPALGSWASSNGIDVSLSGIHTGTTFTPPTNYTEGSDSAGSGGGASSRTTSETAYRSLTAITTVGSITAVAGGTAQGIGAHVFIFEAVAAETITPDKWVPDTEVPLFEKIGVVSYFRRFKQHKGFLIPSYDT